MTDLNQEAREALRKRILRFLRAKPMTSTELEAATGRPRSTIRNLLLRMEEDGQVYGTIQQDGARRFTTRTVQRVITPPALEPVCLSKPHRDPLVAALFGPGGHRE